MKTMNDSRLGFWLIIFSGIYPLMSILGVSIMNDKGNNTLLMVMLLLIPVHVTFLTLLKSRISTAVYPVTLWAISLSLLLMHGLVSNYLVGMDVHAEFYHAEFVARNAAWNTNSDFLPVIQSCVYVTILPSMLEAASGLPILQIFKIVFPVIFSTIPVVLHRFLRRYMDEPYAFLSSFFFVSQITFTQTLQSAMRQGVALLFITLAFMVYFGSKVITSRSRLVWLILLFSVAVSHVASAFILLATLFSSWLLGKFVTVAKSSVKVGFRILHSVLLFMFIFVWYEQLTSVSGDIYEWVRMVLVNLVHLFGEEIRRQQMQLMILPVSPTLLVTLRAVVRNVALVFIAIGVIYLLWSRKNSRFDKEFLMTMSVCMGLAFLPLVVPYLGAYGPGRLFQQMLIFLSPAFVVGCLALCKHIMPKRIRSHTMCLFIILLELSAYFLTATFAVDQILGVPASIDLNKEGSQYLSIYVHDQEVEAAKWLGNKSLSSYPLFMDYVGIIRVIYGYNGQNLPKIYSDLKHAETSTEGYIYLTYPNVKNGIVHTFTPGITSTENIANYSSLFIASNKVYDNGGSQVFQIQQFKNDSLNPGA